MECSDDTSDINTHATANDNADNTPSLEKIFGLQKLSSRMDSIENKNDVENSRRIG